MLNIENLDLHYGAAGIRPEKWEPVFRIGGCEEKDLRTC